MQNSSEQSEIALTLTQDQHDLISQAADALNLDTETFVIRAAIQQCLEALKGQVQSNTNSLTPEEQQRFLALLKDPPTATDELRWLMTLTPIPER